MQPPLTLIGLPFSWNPTVLFHTSERIPNRVSTLSTTLPATNTSARAVYKAGDSGDHSAAWRIGIFATNVCARAGATNFAEVVREATLRPRESSTLTRIFARLLGLSLATFNDERNTDPDATNT